MFKKIILKLSIFLIIFYFILFNSNNLVYAKSNGYIDYNKELIKLKNTLAVKMSALLKLKIFENDKYLNEWYNLLKAYLDINKINSYISLVNDDIALAVAGDGICEFDTEGNVYIDMFGVLKNGLQIDKNLIEKNIRPYYEPIVPELNTSSKSMIDFVLDSNFNKIFKTNNLKYYSDVYPDKCSYKKNGELNILKLYTVKLKKLMPPIVYTNSLGETVIVPVPPKEVDCYVVFFSEEFLDFLYNNYGSLDGEDEDYQVVIKLDNRNRLIAPLVFYPVYIVDGIQKENNQFKISLKQSNFYYNPFIKKVRYKSNNKHYFDEEIYNESDFGFIKGKVVLRKYFEFIPNILINNSNVYNEKIIPTGNVVYLNTLKYLTTNQNKTELYTGEFLINGKKDRKVDFKNFLQLTVNGEIYGFNKFDTLESLGVTINVIDGESNCLYPVIRIPHQNYYTFENKNLKTTDTTISSSKFQQMENLLKGITNDNQSNIDYKDAGYAIIMGYDIYDIYNIFKNSLVDSGIDELCTQWSGSEFLSGIRDEVLKFFNDIISSGNIDIFNKGNSNNLTSGINYSKYYNLQKYHENREKSKIFGFLNSLTFVMGVIILAYAALLAGAYFLDNSTVYGMDLVRIISFGNFSSIDETKILTFQRLLILMIELFIIGTLLMSIKTFELILYILKFFEGFKDFIINLLSSIKT